MSKPIRLPAVKSVHLDFDGDFIHASLQEKTTKGLEKLNWPAAIMALHRKCEGAENKLLHIESCCRKARLEQIEPYKKKLEAIMLIHTQQ